MRIISISLDENTYEEMEAVQKNLGFKSRSKLIRSTMDSMMREYKKFDKITGKNEVVFITTYKEIEKNNVSAILHKFEDAITFTIHQHHASLGLDIINVNADAKRIRELFALLKRSKLRSLDFALLGQS